MKINRAKCILGMSAAFVMSGFAQTAEVYPGLERIVLTVPESVQQQMPTISEKVLFFKQQAPGKKPLILFLHGYGKKPEEIDQATTDSILAKQTSEFKLPFHILQPRVHQGWKPAELDALLDYIVQTYEIDESRIYVGGFSMGGGGTWSYAFEGKHPVAAFFPMASGAAPRGGELKDRNIEALKDKPIWLFFGELDKGFPRGRQTADVLGPINPQFKFTTFPDLGHKKGWALKKRDLYDWLLQHSSK